MSRHDTTAVREHYAALAAAYDAKANKACKRAYRRLVREHLGQARRVLELGAGSSPLLAELDAPFKVACDLSLPMLQARQAAAQSVVADAQVLPFSAGSFDAVFCINMLEHVPSPRQVLEEAARVLVPGGRFLAVTPNGNVEWLLNLLERLKLKLPEGPHRFLSTSDLQSLAPESMNILEHRRMLAFPAGPPGFAEVVDRMLAGQGLFQYALLEAI